MFVQEEAALQAPPAQRQAAGSGGGLANRSGHNKPT